MLCLGKKQEDEDGVENEGFFCQMDGLFMSALHNHCSHHGAVVIAACNDRPLNVTAQNASYPPRTQGWKRESSDTQRHRQTFGIGNGLEEFQIDCDTRRCGSCSKMEMELEIICLHRPTNQPKKKKKATTTNHQRMGDDEGTSGAGSARRVREGVSRSYATENKALDALGEEVGFEAVSLDCVVCSLLGLLLAVGNVTCAVLLLLILLRRTG